MYLARWLLNVPSTVLEAKKYRGVHLTWCQSVGSLDQPAAICQTAFRTGVHSLASLWMPSSESFHPDATALAELKTVHSTCVMGLESLCLETTSDQGHAYRQYLPAIPIPLAAAIEVE